MSDVISDAAVAIRRALDRDTEITPADKAMALAMIAAGSVLAQSVISIADSLERIAKAAEGKNLGDTQIVMHREHVAKVVGGIGLVGHPDALKAVSDL